MLITILSAISLASVPAPGPEATAAPAPAIQLWISNNRQFEPGQPVRVQVETGMSGYLLVLRFDAEGQLRVLFPLDPSDDGAVQAGRRYELRDFGADQSFLAEAYGGAGLVYAALATDPFRLDAFREGGEWNYQALRIAVETEDPEADMTTLVQQVVSSQGFDYDVLDYWVDGPARKVSRAVVRPIWWSPGYDFYDGYDPYYYGASCFSCDYWGGSSVHVSVGIGFGHSWYTPGYWYNGYSWYNPYYYSYRPGGWYYPPYWGNNRYNRPGYYPPVVRPRDYPVVVGRARGYTIERNNPRPARPQGNDAFGRNGTRQDGSSGADRAGPARRARGDGADRARRPEGRSAEGNGPRNAQPRGSEPRAEPKGRPASGAAPPATRARPRGGDRPSTADKPAAAERRIAGPVNENDQMHVVRSRPESGRQDQVRFNDAGGDRREPRPVVREAPPARKAERGSGGLIGKVLGGGADRSRSSGSARPSSGESGGGSRPQAGAPRGGSPSGGRAAPASNPSRGSSGGSAPRARSRPKP